MTGSPMAPVPRAEAAYKRQREHLLLCTVLRDQDVVLLQPADELVFRIEDIEDDADKGKLGDVDVANSYTERSITGNYGGGVDRSLSAIGRAARLRERSLHHQHKRQQAQQFEHRIIKVSHCTTGHNHLFPFHRVFGQGHMNP